MDHHYITKRPWMHACNIGIPIPDSELCNQFCGNSNQKSLTIMEFWLIYKRVEERKKEGGRGRERESERKYNNSSPSDVISYSFIDH